MKGHLVIGGGSIVSDVIYKEFIRLAGGKASKIAIIPSASVEPPRALGNLLDIFEDCGMDKNNIIGIKVDTDTEEGSGWKRSGDDFEALDFLDGVKGVWFAGGDQVKIIRGFQRRDGSDTKILLKIREILSNGGVVGGTSAGAAIMSEVMIGGGTGFGALSGLHYHNYIEYRKWPELEENGSLLIMGGLGFFKEGIIDQHFDKRKRLGRLLEVLFAANVKKGYGISEDTAMIYDMEKSIVRAAGSGGITIVDISKAKRNKVGKYSEITGVEIFYISGEECFSIKESVPCLTSRDNNHINTDIINQMWDILMDTKRESLIYSADKKMHYYKGYQAGDKNAAYEIRLYGDGGHISKGHCCSKVVMDMLPILHRRGHRGESGE